MPETLLRKGLWEVILEQGIQNTHFFNGRLLTAGDLKAEQDANRSQRRQLGLALGSGIVDGLQVRLVHDGADGQPPVLTVDAGLALNRLGEAIQLPIQVEVQLARKQDAPPSEGGLFQICLPPQNGGPLPGKGAYVLAARPASGLREHAPRRSFGESARVESCDRKYAVEGVQFHLEALELSLLGRLTQTARDALASLMEQTDPASLSKLRNWLAHVCLGTQQRDELVRNLLPEPPALPPFGDYGAADALRAAGRLEDCDVPLALVFWPGSGVRFVDNWAVRRRVTRLPYGPWDGLAGDRLLAEGEAAFLQFQDQVAEMTRPTVPRSQLITMEVKSLFRYLPPVGVIPFTTGVSNRGFDYLRFFSGLTVRDPVFTEGRKVHPLVQLSFGYKPVDLSSGEMLWLYLVRENRQPLVGSPTPTPQPYLIFAHGHLPYQGEALFDLSYWNFSNYS